MAWPRVYHGGFNHGTNLAEAINLFTPDVLTYEEYKKRCTCGLVYLCLLVIRFFFLNFFSYNPT